jgi:hypothetical protein
LALPISQKIPINISKLISIHFKSTRKSTHNLFCGACFGLFLGGMVGGLGPVTVFVVCGAMFCADGGVG